jgi:hypothetical protein
MTKSNPIHVSHTVCPCMGQLRNDCERICALRQEIGVQYAMIFVETSCAVFPECLDGVVRRFTCFRISTGGRSVDTVSLVDRTQSKIVFLDKHHALRKTCTQLQATVTESVTSTLIKHLPLVSLCMRKLYPALSEPQAHRAV